jgi:hypothetical protein
MHRKPEGLYPQNHILLPSARAIERTAPPYSRSLLLPEKPPTPGGGAPAAADQMSLINNNHLNSNRLAKKVSRSVLRKSLAI